MNKPIRSRSRGSALPLAVVAIIVLLAMGVGLLSLGFNSRTFSLRMASDIEARCAADAGLAMALFEMNEKLKVKPWNGSSLPGAIDVKLPYSDEVCSYRVTGNLAGGYVIQSVGQSGNATRCVQATIGLQSAFNHAILTKNALWLKSNTVIDGYNSADPTDTEFVVDIGSQGTANDTIVLNTGVNVKGNVFVGPGADLDTAIKIVGGTVGGDKYTAAKEPLPPVTAPALPIKPAIDVSGKTLTITPADSGSYPEIYLRQLVIKGKNASITPSVLEVSGGDVVLHLTGDIQLENSCEIIVKPGSTLTIYTDGNIHARNGSSISTESPPEAGNTLEIYATGQDKQSIDIKAKSEFTGVIYAPNADVVLYAKGNAYGSIVADSFSYMSGGNYYYDEALSKVTVDDEAVYFAVERWQEDPSKLLALD
ncbi:MAG: hypothetical protein ABIF19_04480 [Planctomycetota bacterium]